MGRPVSAALLAKVLGDPEAATTLDPEQWSGIIAAARAEQLVASLAWRVDGLRLPSRVLALLADAHAGGQEARRAALWEAEMVRRVLQPLGTEVVLLKGTAFHAAGLSAAQGRHVGDLDLLVARDQLASVERALRGAGWESVKQDAYDDAYYRTWMHELPPLIHRDRDRMVDVHHTILPPTTRASPDAAALLAAARPLGHGLHVLSPEDMVVHASLHLFADGDLAGGLRNLWDIDRLLREFAEVDGDWWLTLAERAALHQAGRFVARAARLSHHLFATPVPAAWQRLTLADRAYARRLLARDGWGRETRPVTRLAFYVRSHWIRMPPLLLARHLSIKAWRGVVQAR